MRARVTASASPSTAPRPRHDSNSAPSAARAAASTAPRRAESDPNARDARGLASSAPISTATSRCRSSRLSVSVSTRIAIQSWVQEPKPCQWSSSGPKDCSASAGSAAVRAAEVSSVCRAMPAMNDSPASSARATASVRYRAACGSFRSARHSPRVYVEPRADGHRPGAHRELGQLPLVPDACVVVARVGGLEGEVGQGERRGLRIGGRDGQLEGEDAVAAGRRRGRRGTRTRWPAPPPRPGRQRARPTAAATSMARRACRSPVSRSPRCHNVCAW